MLEFPLKMGADAIEQARATLTVTVTVTVTLTLTLTLTPILNLTLTITRAACSRKSTAWLRYIHPLSTVRLPYTFLPGSALSAG